MGQEGLLTFGRIATDPNGGGREQIIKPVRVEDIILDVNHIQAKKYGGYDSIGTIFYTNVAFEGSRNAQGGANGNPENLHSARPLFSFLKQYPLKNEIVMIITSPSKDFVSNHDAKSAYYLPNLNVWNHQHHNALPDMRYYSNTPEQINDYIAVSGGLIRTAADGQTEIELGEYFKEKISLQPMLPFEGDSILEGRFGNSIRLGGTPMGAYEKTAYSTTGSFGDPITIIRNGQLIEDTDNGWEHTIENINTDHSSIYLMSNQMMANFEVVSKHWESWNVSYDTLNAKDAISSFDNITAGPDIVKEQETTEDKQEDEDELMAQNEVPESAELETEELECVANSEPVCGPPDDELSIYDQLIAQDNFDEDEFLFEDVTIGGGGPSDGQVEDTTYIEGDEREQNEITNTNEKQPEASDGTKSKDIKENSEKNIETYNNTGEPPTKIYSKTDYNVWKDAGADQYPIEVFHKNNKDCSIIVNPLKASEAESAIASSRKNPNLKAIVCHLTAGNYRTNYQFAWSMFGYKNGDKPWRAPGYTWTVDDNGFANQNRLDDQLTYGASNEQLEPIGVRRSQGGNHYMWENGDPGNQTVDICWLGNKVDGITPLIPGWRDSNCTKAQFRTYYRIIKAYHKKYPNAKIYGHNNLALKWCPGFNMHVFLTELGFPEKVIPGKLEYYDVTKYGPEAFGGDSSKYVKNAIALANFVK
tara:strand:+ start:210 stop:2315 length:2106 start_codon:yes stop_codon:yes gene_type:complete